QYVQMAFFSKCQALSIGEQLDAGFRYLDIRLGVDTEKGALQLMHGFTKCKTGVFSDTLLLEGVLEDCFRFLDAHPGETLIFAVKQEHGNESVSEFETLLDAVIRKNESRWLLRDSLPTLGEARGKLVLLRRYEDEAGLGARAGLPFLWTNQSGSAEFSLHAAAEPNGDFTLWVQDRYEYGSEDKWNAFTAGMNAARERAQGDIAVHFLSTKGTLAYGHPYLFAKRLDQKLLQANLALDGWIIVDFASAPLAERIYSANA
ncbi:MAG: phosphatidylinositol-specific phospholipase C domain-containing protein, partial [Oscillospiraceae bacterium]|nr:phosphatidylinositol-specific phospholipase C domain-containing protein [Oscillospiraceae bacterium]